MLSSHSTERRWQAPATRPLFESGWRRRWAYGAVVLAVVGSALALGGAHVRVVVSVAALITAAFILALLHGSVRSIPLPASFLAALGAYSLLQSVPLPLSVLTFLSPEAADVWGRALRPFDESVSYGSLSLDPGASCVEALKWFSYAVLFTLASAHAKRHGSSAGITLVFASAVVLALASLGHMLAGAKTVFGIYEPMYIPGRIGPILNKNCLAGYLNLGILCGLGLAFSSGQTARKWLWMGGVAVLVGMVVLTGSRGGVLALAVGVLAFAGFLLWSPSAKARRRRLSFRDWAPLGAVAIGIAFSFLGSSSLDGLFQQDVEKLKLSAWVTDMVRDYPVFGIGRGAFEGVFPAYHSGAHNSIYSHPENIVAQWVAEWGTPIVLAAAAGFGWTLRPQRLGLGRAASSTGALIGICVVVLQNFVDFSLELMGPALAAVLVLGSCWGERNATPSSESTRARSRKQGLILTGALCLCLVLATVRGLQTLGADRYAINEHFAALDLSDEEGAVHEIWSLLREAMLRHPSEAYFPRVGALLALRTGTADPMPWVQRSLERCLTSGETHLVVAHALAARRALRQALLETRLAVDYNPRLSDEVGRIVVRWTRNPEELELAAPRNEAGSNVMLVAAQQLTAPEQTDVRQALLRAAIRRAPGWPLPRRVLAAERLRELNGPRCTGALRTTCIEEILSHARALDMASPKTADAVQLAASLYSATGQAEEARRAIEPRCSQLEGAQAVRCWSALLGVLRAHPTDPAVVVRTAQQLATRACEVEVDCSKAQVQAADAALQVQDWTVALKLYQEAAETNPSAPLLVKVADVAGKLGQYALADRALARAAARVGNNPKLRRQIANKRSDLRAAPVAP